ncbi:Polyamine oxidase 1-like protein [Drosera capensis]
MVSRADPPTSPSVIIVGAGISGISAAKTLHEAGIHDFIILDATSRIGGRIKKEKFAGHTIEVGANWLHGTGTGGSKSSPLFEMAKEIKLKMGGLFSKEEVETTMQVAETADEMGAKLSKYWASKPGVPITPLEMVTDYFYHDYEDSEPPRITGLKHTLPRCAKEDFGTHAHFVADPRGFEAVVHHIAKQFLSYKGEDITDPRIKLNQVVRKIYYSKSGVEVTTEDGCTYHAEAAIVSVSVGVLQSDLIAFEPALPEWKEQAITEFSMGKFTKIFLQFPNRFWPTGPGTEFFLYAHQRRGYYPVWQHLENEMSSANILFVVMTHEESARIEQQSNNETIAEVMQVLRKMFGDDIPEPSRIFVPRWKSDRFYRGAYSNWPNGYSEAKHQQLCEPVGPVHFTGEHTNVPYLGYADGAYLAGIKTANDVIRYLQKSCICEHRHEESITLTVGRKL